MSKTKMKKKTRRASYKCGGCGESGHNARTCPNKNKTSTAQKSDTPEKVEVTPDLPVVAISQTQDLTADFRNPSSRPARPPAPFECPVCLRCGILCIVENDIGQKLLRCEHCYTKCTPKFIIKWGVLPEDKPANP